MKKILNAYNKKTEVEVSDPAISSDSGVTPIIPTQYKNLQDAVERHIEGQLSPRYRKSTGFSPSNDQTCARFWWYKFQGVEIPVTHDHKGQRIFDVGHDVHARIVRYFDEMGILIEAEMPVPQKEGCPPVSGFIDAVIEWKGPLVIEIKSTNHEGFMMRQMYKKPSAKHYQQIQWYMHYTGIHRGVVLYECKNTQNFYFCNVRYDEEFMRKLLSKYDKIYKKASAKEIPERPSAYNSDRCIKCQLRSVCWNGEEQ